MSQAGRFEGGYIIHWDNATPPEDKTDQTWSLYLLSDYQYRREVHSEDGMLLGWRYEECGGQRLQALQQSKRCLRGRGVPGESLGSRVVSRSNLSVKFATAAVLELEIVGNTGKYAAALQPIGNPKRPCGDLWRQDTKKWSVCSYNSSRRLVAPQSRLRNQDVSGTLQISSGSPLKMLPASISIPASCRPGASPVNVALPAW